MATKAFMLLSFFLLAILPIPFLTSAREFSQNPQTHAISGEGKAEEAGHGREVSFGALAPNSPPNVPVRPCISYSPHKPIFRPLRPIHPWPCRPTNPAPYSPPCP